MDKGSGSGIFPDPDPGDPKKPDPTGSGSATLVSTLKRMICNFDNNLSQLIIMGRYSINVVHLLILIVEM